MSTYESRSKLDTEDGPTAKCLEAGAVEIAKALWGTSVDATGSLRPVGGDRTMVRRVAGSSVAAERFSIHIQHVSRKVPGRQEVRRRMRLDTHTNRLRRHGPVFPRLRNAAGETFFPERTQPETHVDADHAVIAQSSERLWA